MMSLPFAGTNSSAIKLQNISAVLLTLLHNPNTSRVHLANQIGVSSATITNLVSELTRDGLVIEDGNVKTNGQVGRPQVMLSIVPEARFAIGVHIDVGMVYIGLSNLIGEIVDRESFQHSLDDTWESVLDKIVATISVLEERNASRCDIILGVGVAASGLVNVQTGINAYAPNLGWVDVPLRDYLQERLPYPVVVENNVRAMAFGEAMFGCARNINAMAFIYGRVGVGAGFVVGRQLFRGAGEGAGEIGHTTLMFATDSTTPAKPHTLESLVSERAIVTMARSMTGRDLTFKQIIWEAQTGSNDLKRLLLDRATFMGFALANLVNIFNPEMIVLGGIFQQASTIMLPQIIETVQQHSFADLWRSVSIVTSDFGQEVGMIGSAGLALDTFFYRAGRIEGVA